eukprot:scaffold305350_cov14-Tisochrysis_lutea.AAC.1
MSEAQTLRVRVSVAQSLSPGFRARTQIAALAFQKRPTETSKTEHRQTYKAHQHPVLDDHRGNVGRRGV